MKRYYVPILLIATAIVFSYCSSSKKASKASAAKMVYDHDVQALLSQHCTPCHIPEKGGNKKAYDNYANVKADIDDIIHRISLNPGDRGFMPMKGPKLSDSTINVFKQWKTDGMLEK